LTLCRFFRKDAQVRRRRGQHPPEAFREAHSILDTFQGYASTPYVVAANKQDQEDAWTPEDLRIALKVDSRETAALCCPRQRERQNVLLELMRHPGADGGRGLMQR
jgi:signal recognition particle receptor subunit beta